MQKITPFLWFDGNLEDAVRFYASIFKDARIVNLSPMSATFEIGGQSFMGLNGGPMYKFSEAISFFIRCEDQDEVDYYWSRLLADGGSAQMCGWLKDRFGLSWQVIPNILGAYLSDADGARRQRVMDVMMKMKKLDVDALQRAHAG